MNEELEKGLDLTFRAFLLEQVNHPRSREESWKIWEDPEEESRDLPPHEAALSVKHHHGRDAFQRYHRNIFRAWHEEEQDITDPDVLVRLIEELDLDGEPIREDLRAGSFRDAIGEQHEKAETMGIFGVPTLLFNDTQPTFLKLDELEGTPREDVELFYDIFDAARHPEVLTIKKPDRAATLKPAGDRPE